MSSSSLRILSSSSSIPSSSTRNLNINNNNNLTLLLGGFLLGTSCTVLLMQLFFHQQQKQNTTNDKEHDKEQMNQRGIPLVHKKNNNNNNNEKEKKQMKKKEIPVALRQEQLSRHTLYFGQDGMDNIRSCKVCVVGIGGVGSHTAIMLARGGVETIRLIDFDQVTLSSLNRHACATLADVGIPKVSCVQKFCRDGLGVPNVEAKVEMYTSQTGPELLSGYDWDLIIDCIDDVPTKATLLSYCIKHKIRVFSCMGAGGKSDMTRLHISDLRTAAKDPLASKLRQTMKRVMKKQQQEEQQEEQTNNNYKEGEGEQTMDDSYLDDMDQLTIIYSSEKTVAKLAEFTEEQKLEADKSQYGSVDGMRIRILPVLGPMPAIMGQSLASMALCELGKKPIRQPVTGERVSRNVRNKLFQHLTRREGQIERGTLIDGIDVHVSELEQRKSGTMKLYVGPVQVDHDDMEYMIGLWRNRCAVTGAKLGTVLSFVRWDMDKPATCDNLVLMSTHAIKDYDTYGRSNIPSSIQKRIEDRLASCREPNNDIY